MKQRNFRYFTCLLDRGHINHSGAYFFTGRYSTISPGWQESISHRYMMVNRHCLIIVQSPYNSRRYVIFISCQPVGLVSAALTLPQFLPYIHKIFYEAYIIPIDSIVAIVPCQFHIQRFYRFSYAFMHVLPYPFLGCLPFHFQLLFTGSVQYTVFPPVAYRIIVRKSQKIKVNTCLF